MNARRRHLRTAACLTLVGLLACLPLAAAFGSVDEDDMVLRLSAAERALPPDRLPDLDASCAALMDEDGTLWFGRNADDAAQIASLTKIMTAIVAADWLDASTMIEVTPEAASVGESSAGLAQGDSMTFDDALKALLTASGNDAASAIAQAAGARMLAQEGSGGDAYACEATFVEAMNAKAAELGLENSFFANPHGLDFDAFAQGQYSCAADVATMLRAAMQIDLVRANIGFSQADITVQRDGAPVTLALENTDALLGSYPGACAAKTGYTLAAGPCAATAVNRGDGHEYYAVVLGSSSKPQRFVDSAALYDWAYANRSSLRAPFRTRTSRVWPGANAWRSRSPGSWRAGRPNVRQAAARARYSRSSGSTSTATFASLSGLRRRKRGSSASDRSASAGHFTTICQRYVPRSFASTHGVAGSTLQPSPPKSRTASSSAACSSAATRRTAGSSLLHTSTFAMRT